MNRMGLVYLYCNTSNGNCAMMLSGFIIISFEILSEYYLSLNQDVYTIILIYTPIHREVPILPVRLYTSVFTTKLLLSEYDGLKRICSLCTWNAKSLNEILNISTCNIYFERNNC